MIVSVHEPLCRVKRHASRSVLRRIVLKNLTIVRDVLTMTWTNRLDKRPNFMGALENKAF